MCGVPNRDRCALQDLLWLVGVTTSDTRHPPMWSALTRFFVSSDATQGDQRDGQAIDSEMSRDELASLRAQISSVQLQLDTSKRAILDIARQQDAMTGQRCTLMLECHDGYLHPQLEDLDPPLVSNVDATFSPAWVAEQRAIAAEAAAEAECSPSAEDGEILWLTVAAENGYVPFCPTEPSTEEVRARIRAALERNAETLATTLPKMLDALREKRHKTDDFIFDLECRLARLESQERQVGLRVNELTQQTAQSDAITRANNEARRRELYRDDGAPMVEVVVEDPMSPERRGVQPKSDTVEFA
jgi:hypothetical protein